MRLFIAGGCGEHGRNSFLLEDHRICVLVDCGIAEGEPPFPQLSKGQIGRIRYLFLTHSHKDHCGAVEWLISNGFHGSIISTEETKRQCRIAYDDWKILTVIENMPNSIKIEPMLWIKYGRSGHCTGSIWLLIEWNDKSVLFTGDYKEKSPVYICDEIRNISVDCAVVDCAYGNNIINYTKAVDRIIDVIRDTTVGGGTVLMPVPKFGRGMELIQILKKSGIDIPVYGDNGIWCQESLEYNVWTKTEYPVVEPFEMWKGEPAVLFITDPQLRKKKNYYAAMKVYKRGGLILLTGHVYRNTGAEQLLEKKIAQKIPYPVHMNYNEVYDLVKENKISNVILNHHNGKISDHMEIALSVENGTMVEF